MAPDSHRTDPSSPSSRTAPRRTRAAGRRAARLSSSQVWRLQSMRSEPSVSLLLTTTPATRLDQSERARLRALHHEALERLTAEPAARAAAVAALRVRLDRLVAKAEHVAPDRALALYASAEHAELIVLPIAVPERVVVDATFATRDLVRALHRTPKHLVLLLSAREARLLEGHAEDLAPAPNSKFPLHAGSGDRQLSTPAFLATVDRALAAYRRAHPSPLIVVGAEPTLSAFRGMATSLDRLAGVVRGNHMRASLQRLDALTAPVLEDYLLSRQVEALQLLATRGNEGRAILGIDGAWLIARWGIPEMLAVEHDFFFPARLTADGDGIEAADDVDSPDVIDDLVDELIELVMLRGGWVALVEPGSLPGRSRIALTQRLR